MTPSASLPSIWQEGSAEDTSHEASNIISAHGSHAMEKVRAQRKIRELVLLPQYHDCGVRVLTLTYPGHKESPGAHTAPQPLRSESMGVGPRLQGTLMRSQD